MVFKNRFQMDEHSQRFSSVSFLASIVTNDECCNHDERKRKIWLVIRSELN